MAKAIRQAKFTVALTLPSGVTLEDMKKHIQTSVSTVGHYSPESALFALEPNDVSVRLLESTTKYPGGV